MRRSGKWNQVEEIGDWRFLIYDWRFLIYDWRFLIYDWRLGIGDWGLGIDESDFYKSALYPRSTHALLFPANYSSDWEKIGDGNNVEYDYN